ncbi:MAG: hypothetical protein LUQ38_11620 [Methanotrichaceae archaeon]|nr:hypothetical protein [Methanotrichaceae archaeon]
MTSFVTECGIICLRHRQNSIIAKMLPDPAALDPCPSKSGEIIRMPSSFAISSAGEMSNLHKSPP